MNYAGLDVEIPAGDTLDGVTTVPLGSARRDRSGGTVSCDVAFGLSLPSVGLGAADSLGDSLGIGTRGAGVFMGEGLPPSTRALGGADMAVGVHGDVQTPARAAGRPEDRGRHSKTTKSSTGPQERARYRQCFAVFVGVVAKTPPEAVPGLMAYMISIIRASQEYEGAAWAAYDAAFRRQAAATGQRDWGKINSSLYTICFTGKAKRSQRYDNCLSAAHKTAECYAVGDEEPDVAGRVRAVESALLAFSTNHGSPAGRGPRSAEVCRLFN